MLTILSVAYPLARVGPDAVGGAEQVLSMLDEAIHAAGHRSLVVACEGSRCAGELVAVPASRGSFDAAAITSARTTHRRTVEGVVRRTHVDVVHMHGVDFDAYLPPEPVPVLATLHCPPDWYRARALAPHRAETYLNAVSSDQHRRLAGNPRLLPPIENGVPVEALAGRYRRRGFALMLSRIAPEKGVHLALAAAHAARLPLLVAGELFPYSEHTRYFAREVAPRLDRERRWIGPVGRAAKRRLLGAARCLIVCSQVPETSSLAAREALAAGTPVVALRHGALADVVAHGLTGLLVDEVGDLAQALHGAGKLDADVCRRIACRRFDAAAMAERYLEVYGWLAGRTRREAAAVGAT